jgi:hypothetical protein
MNRYEMNHDEYRIITVAYHGVTGEHMLSKLRREEVAFAFARAKGDITATIIAITGASSMVAMLAHDKAGQSLGLWS